MSLDKDQEDYARALKESLDIVKHPICTYQDRQKLTQITTTYPKLLYEKVYSGRGLLDDTSGCEFITLLYDLAKDRMIRIIHTLQETHYVMEETKERSEITKLLNVYPSLLIAKFLDLRNESTWMLKGLKVESLDRIAIDAAKPYLKRLIEQNPAISDDHVSDLRILVSNYPALLTQHLSSSDTSSTLALTFPGHKMFIELYIIAKGRLEQITQRNTEDFPERLKEVETLVNDYPRLLIEDIDLGPSMQAPLYLKVNPEIKRIFNEGAKKYLNNLIKKNDKSSVDKVGCIEKVLSLYSHLLTQKVSSGYTVLELAKQNQYEEAIDIVNVLLSKPSIEKFCDNSTQTEDILPVDYQVQQNVLLLADHE